MISNPFAAVPFKEQAWSEGFCQALAALASPTPGETIAEEDFDAFNAGVAAGEEATVNGIPFDAPCVPAQEGAPGHGVGLAIDGAHLLHAAWEARHLARVAASLTALLAVVAVVVTVGASAQHAQPANEVLPGLGQQITERLLGFGAGSL
jgi:hypothetical protein